MTKEKGESLVKKNNQHSAIIFFNLYAKEGYFIFINIPRSNHIFHYLYCILFIWLSSTNVPDKCIVHHQYACSNDQLPIELHVQESLSMQKLCTNYIKHEALWKHCQLRQYQYYRCKIPIPNIDQKRDRCPPEYLNIHLFPVNAFKVI